MIHRSKLFLSISTMLLVLTFTACTKSTTSTTDTASTPTVSTTTETSSPKQEEKKVDEKNTDEYAIEKNNMSHAAFMALKPTEPMTLRLYAGLGNYFLNLSSEYKEEDYWSIAFWFPDNKNLATFAYISKASKSGEKLFEYLKDGNHSPVTMTLKFVKSKDGEYPSTSIFIENIEKIGW